MLPWYIRSLGVIKISEAMQPGVPAMPKANTPLAKGTNTPSPTTTLTSNTNAALAQNVMNNQDLFAPKLGSDKQAGEIPTQAMMNLATNLGDDAITLAIRQLARDAQTGLTIPAAVEKVQQINNPEDYASSQFSGPSVSQLRRALGFIGKLASAGNCQAPEAAGTRPLLPNAASNALMRSDVVTNAIGQNADTATGSFPKSAGEGNAQGVLSGNLPHRGISQNAAATSRPELSTEFDKMKAFNKNETPPMNSLGQGGDVVP